MAAVLPWPYSSVSMISAMRVAATLPLQRSAFRKEKMTKPLPVDNVASQDNQLTVLVVDDTAVNRQILSVFLQKLGFRCVMAGDGDEAVAVFERERPDIILMDVMMPDVNGYEATRRIREKGSERWVPVIFISALDRNDNLI